MTGILQALLASVSAAVSAVTDEYFEYVTMLLPGNGTNGAQNNTFTDGSSNAFTITRNGNTTQGTFSPYGDNWSNYFLNADIYPPAGSSFSFTGDFTVEFFINIQTTGTGSPSYIIQLLPSDTYFAINAVAGTGFDIYLNSGSISMAVTDLIPSVGRWHHVALVRSGSSVKLYMDGVASSTTATNSSTLGSSTANFYICNNNVPAVYMSNVRVVKGTAVYTTNFTPPTSNLTAITNTVLLTCQNNRFKDNSSNNFTMTLDGTPSVQRFSPFSPTAAYASGTIGGSGYFDGTGDYLGLTDSSNLLDIGGAVASIECWYYPTAQPAYGILISKGGGAASWSATNGFEYQLSYTSGTFTVYYNTGGGNSASIANTVTSPLSQWYHVVVATDASNNLSLFVNGTRVATATNAITKPTTRTTVNIGNDVSGSYPSGYISGMRVIVGTGAYSASSTTLTIPTAPPTAITNTQLLTNFTNAGIIDNAMMNDLETVGNAQISTTQSKFGGSSMYFDGTGDWLVGNFASKDLYSFGTGNFTVEMWVYTSNLSNYQTLLDTRASDSQTAWCLFIDNTGKPYWYDASGVQLSSTAISSNTWTHLAIARSGSTLKMFLGGTEVFSGTNTNSQNPTGTFYVGRNAVNAFLYTGYIDDLRITKGVARYTANFTAPTAAFPTS